MSKIFGIDALELAKTFHDSYEKLAPDYNYETRPETKTFDENSINGKLMVAVCESVIEMLSGLNKTEEKELIKDILDRYC